MKKRLSIAVSLFVLLFIRVASAQAAEIVSIDVEAILHHDGSATITEIWTTAGIYEGTQISRIIDLPNSMSVHSLEVQSTDGSSGGGFSLVILVLIATTITVISAITIMIYRRTKLSHGTIKKWPSISGIPVKYRVPFDISLPAIYYLITQSSPFYTKGSGSAFGAYLLKWNHEGIIDLTKVKSRHVITLHPLQINLSEIEHMLYEILEHHVENNHKFSSHATKKWEKMMEKIHEWEGELYEHGAKELYARGMLANGEKIKYISLQQAMMNC